jgi:Fic family protein
MSQIEEFLQSVDRAKAELDSLRPLAREQEDRAMQKFRLWWTYHSNAIEGNTLTQGETEMFLMEGLTAKGKPLKDHLDLRGHSNAINYLLGFVHNKEVLTEAAIRKLHEILLVEPYQVQAITAEGLPTMKTVALGQYKTQPNHVRTPTGETHYYATPEETPARMHGLMNWYRQETADRTMHPVEIAARYHHRFTEIHPFDDGNGRMSRLLMNLMLMQDGYPPAVIRIGERNQYLAALRRADAGEYDDFLTFITEHVMASLELFIRAAKGEEIHEPTDLEKEIKLLKMELLPGEEAGRPSPEAQKHFFESSLDPLFTEVARQITPLCDLFRVGVATLDATYSYVTGMDGHTLIDDIEIQGSRRMPRDPTWWVNGSVVQDILLSFKLKGLKKFGTGRRDFEEAIRLTLGFKRYRLQLEHWMPAYSIEHAYQDSLSKEEIADVAQNLTKSFVEIIKINADVHL